MISNVAVVLKFLLIFFTITQIQSDNLVEGPNAENQCGVSLSASGLIYNGKVVKRNQWPFLVALMYTADGKFFCSGTLISRSHVLTAAHCLQEKGQEAPLTPSEFVLHLGKYNLSLVYDRGSITAFPEKIKIHPNWNIYQVKYDSDIALIKIDGTVPLRSNIYPACLWSSAIGMRNIQTGTVVGWGVIEDQLTTQNQLIPRQIDLKVVTNEVCYENKFMAGLISSRTFCAIGENGSGPCKGDSGGGLYMKANIKWFIKGIVSSSLLTDEGMCDVEKYSIFTDVAKFSNWIAKEMDIETDITCKFILDDGTDQYKNGYHCWPEKLVIHQPNVKVSNIIGVHLGQRNNNDVKYFSVEHQETSYLPHGVPELFPNVRRYSGYHTKLKHIQRSDFSGFQFLTIIVMAENELVNIPADTFYDVPGLEYLSLRGNQIASFDVDLFIKSPNLKTFYAFRNQIEYLDGRLFRKNFNLEEIHMDYNKFKYIDLDLFTPLKKLKLVNFRHNTCISEHFPETKDFESFKAIIATSCSI
ncbi:CLUMA_CG016756, isoform A [Clunio marinus]|uniref:CLUMA_CG016756, isoform A n=1 Tax=Clunio marinus TaxID=568069 RepID=A0A1J1ITZ5_9DIPT|nr:CLUMA_CG016756, isoform A [Clunio marinus]